MRQQPSISQVQQNWEKTTAEDGPSLRGFTFSRDGVSAISSRAILL
jgi:hypothetical protein